MGADRIDVVEGVLDDLAHGKVPNVPAEMGIKSEWQHNKTGLATKVAVIAAVSGVAWFLLSRRGKGDGDGGDKDVSREESASARPATPARRNT
jgi:hypothetical protein